MIVSPAHRLEDVGEYYFSRKLKQIAEMRSQGIDVINLGIGDPDLPPSGATIRALIDSARHPAHHGYQEYRGVSELRRAIADWYRKVYGVTLDHQREVLPLLGSKEGIFHISMAFLNRGDEVLVPDPGYPAYSAAARLAGATPRHYTLDEEKGWLPDFDALQRSDLRHVKILWLNYPHMPTGARASNSFFRAAVAFGRGNRILVCHDNPYSMVLPDGEPLSILGCEGASEVALELNSLSKSHNMAGWRVGWVSGQADHIDAILMVKSNIDSGMFLPVQHAAIEALRNPDDWHEQRNEEYAKRRNHVWEFLDALGCRYRRDQGGLFVWARVNDAFPDGETFADDLLGASHVFVTPGSVFGRSGKMYIRVSLTAGLKTIAEASARARQYVGGSALVKGEVP